MAKNILIFCSDGISLDKGFLTGGGLRSRQFIGALEPYFKCFAVEPNTANNKLFDVGYDVTVESQLALVELYKPDFVLFLNASAAVSTQSDRFECPYGLDIHGPIHIESSLINGSTAIRETELLRRVTEKASLITVANERQRYGILYGAFLQQKYLLDAHRVATLPVYFPNECLKHTAEENSHYLYSVGSVYPWQDPVGALLTVLDALPTKAKLRVVGGPHSGLRNEFEINTFLRDLSVHPTAEVFGQVARSELDEHLKAAKAIVDLSVETSERTLAANTRVAEFLSLGIPVLVDGYSYYGEFLRQSKLEELVVVNHGSDLREKAAYLAGLDAKKSNALRRKIHRIFHAAPQFKEIDEWLAMSIKSVLD